MNEVLTRRFSEYEKSKDSTEGFGKLPDLILLDGGVGQVHAVEPVLREFGLKIPLFGMVRIIDIARVPFRVTAAK